MTWLFVADGDNNFSQVYTSGTNDEKVNLLKQRNVWSTA